MNRRIWELKRQKTEKMKKNILNWMAIALMAFVCVGFTACGSDDDDDDDDDGGSSSIVNGAVVNGQTISVTQGFWNFDRHKWILDFSNVDLRNFNRQSSIPNGGLNVVAIDFEGAEGNEVPTGEFDKFHVYIVKGMTTSSEGVHMEGSTVYKNPSNAKLVIKKSGNNYTVSYTNLPIGDDNQTINNTSFSFTGPLTFYDGMD